MKKIASVSLWLLLCLHLLYPIGIGIASAFNCNFMLFHELFYGVIVFVLSLFLTVIIMKKYASDLPKHAAVAAALLPAAAMINAFFFLLHAKDATAAVCILITAVFAIMLSAEAGAPTLLKGIGVAVFCCAVIPIGLLTLVRVSAGDLTQNTVVATYPSPDGAYYVEITDSDQGALGGDTFVRVYRNQKLNFVLFRIEPKPQHLLTADFGAYQTMTVVWKDSTHVSIDGTVYEVYP